MAAKINWCGALACLALSAAVATVAPAQNYEAEQRELAKAFALCHGGFLIPEPVEACDAVSARWASIGTTRGWDQRERDAAYVRHVAEELSK